MCNELSKRGSVQLVGLLEHEYLLLLLLFKSFFWRGGWLGGGVGEYSHSVLALSQLRVRLILHRFAFVIDYTDEFTN